MDVITTTFGYTGDSLPESHPLYDFHGKFYIGARVSRCRPATYYEPAEGGECEITSVRLANRREREEENATIENLFWALIDSDRDLELRVFEALGDEFEEACRDRGYSG